LLKEGNGLWESRHIIDETSIWRFNDKIADRVFQVAPNEVKIAIGNEDRLTLYRLDKKLISTKSYSLKNLNCNLIQMYEIKNKLMALCTDKLISLEGTSLKTAYLSQ